MTPTKEYKNFIIQWNNKFIYDRWWRLKHKVPLFSPEHNAMCQIDIYFEYLEERAYEEAAEFRIKEKLMAEEYEKGNFLTRKESPEEMSEEDEDLFSRIDLGSANAGLIDIVE